MQNVKKLKSVYNLLTTAVFNSLRKWVNHYGDFDLNDVDKDLYAEYTHIYFEINGDGRFFKIRPDGFPEIQDGADIYIYNNGNVEMKLYCYPEETIIPLMIFEKEDNVDETVKQIVKLFSLLIESLVLGDSIYNLERDLRNVLGSEEYNWKDVLNDYEEES